MSAARSRERRRTVTRSARSAMTWSMSLWAAGIQSQGAMAIFTSREAAEEFVRNDPFVELRDWDEVLAP